MRRVVAIVLLVAVGAAVGLAGLRLPSAQPGGAEAPVAPVVTVRTALPRVQAVDETVDALGEVAYGEVGGLGFARAGQIRSLAVQVGDRVRRGAVLATLLLDPAARQAWQQALDARALAARELDRQQQLLQAHLATQSQVDTAGKVLRDAEGAVQALDALGGGSASSELVAPFDGVVTALTALQGDRVAAGAAVLQLGRTDRLRVLIGVEPSLRPRLRHGTPVRLQALAPAQPLAPSGEATPSMAATIDTLQETIDPKTQLLPVLLRLSGSAAQPWLPGMKVSAHIQVALLTAVTVPRSAVLSDEHGEYLFQVRQGKAHRLAVHQRLDAGGVVAVDGLADIGLPVVTEGNYELSDGMAVREAAP